MKKLSEEDINKISIFKPIKDLDCEIRIIEKEFNDDYTKDSVYFSCEVGLCESLGERGFNYTLFYDEFPTEEEIIEDVKEY